MSANPERNSMQPDHCKDPKSWRKSEQTLGKVDAFSAAHCSAPRGSAGILTSTGLPSVS